MSFFFMAATTNFSVQINFCLFFNRHIDYLFIFVQSYPTTMIDRASITVLRVDYYERVHIGLQFAKNEALLAEIIHPFQQKHQNLINVVHSDGLILFVLAVKRKL